MKKLMIAAAIVCAAAMSQAASVSWKAGTHVQPDGKADAASGTLTISVFLVDKDVYDATALADIWGTYGQTTTKAMTESADTFKTGGGGSVSANASTTITDADKGTTMYGIIVGTYDAAKDGTIDMYTVNKYAVNINASGSVVNAPADLLKYINGDSASGNVSWTAVPEPTSGLLLLLGVAGLALRRRRA